MPFVAAALSFTMILGLIGAAAGGCGALHDRGPSSAQTRVRSPATRTVSDPSSGATANPAATVTPAGAQARFRVIVPQDDAELTVDGEIVPGFGVVREAAIPRPGTRETFESRLTVTWQPNNYTLLFRHKLVRFTAGDEITIDLTAEDAGDRAEIRFVPSPEHIVQEMIALAGVTGDDVVYDLGCGDGRIVILAVEAGAGRGVGIDLDPQRVAQASANVASAGLVDRIEIRLGDALDVADLSEATVVFLYMGEEFNMLMRPILWSRLDVGARVISYRFAMGDWRPDRTVTVRDEGAEYAVYVWTITEKLKERADHR